MVLCFFADCAVVPEPDAAQLAEITVTGADFIKKLTKCDPRIALLSFSTKGSAEHPSVDKVKQAVDTVKSKRPELVVDGELQVDAAIIPEIGKKKSPGSTLAGKANFLVFPDLNSGNIGYKLVQRLAKAEAYGPFLTGLAKPFSDLSRGCDVEDIVRTVTILEV